MKTAQDVMDANVLRVDTDMEVRDLAEKLLASHADGAVVVHEGKLVGVVTAMDLVFKEKNLHIPPMLAFLDGLIPMESPKRVKKEMEKIAGATVGQIMTSSVISVSPNAELSEVATLMVEKHLTIVPVTAGGKILGVVTKEGMLRAMV